jgi:hypothetical protein
MLRDTVIEYLHSLPRGFADPEQGFLNQGQPQAAANPDRVRIYDVYPCSGA